LISKHIHHVYVNTQEHHQEKQIPFENDKYLYQTSYFDDKEKTFSSQFSGLSISP
jgi:hypothetical protein